MIKKLYFIPFLFICLQANAQCVGEVKSVGIDQFRGSIVVETEYKLNGSVVQTGKTRYNEENGTAVEIDLKIKADIEEHCSNLIARNNQDKIDSEMLKIATDKTTPIKTELETLAVGDKYTVTKTIQTFKDKQIEVTADGQKTVTAIAISEPAIVE